MVGNTAPTDNVVKHFTLWINIVNNGRRGFPTNVMRIPNTEWRHSGQIRCICVKIHFDESCKKPLLDIECNLIEAYQITT